MHTFERNGVRIHYNSDYSGDAIISRDASPANVEVAVPCSTLFAFVGDCARRWKESKEDTEVIGFLLGEKQKGEE